jgi:hypothetical protein
MGAIIDFIAGRSNKLLRDMLLSSALVAVVCVGAMSALSGALGTMKLARQPLPQKVQTAQNAGSGQTTTIVRSILDDAVLTGSVGGRTIILDPCTGKEKK